jgi:hypothetical protein
MRARIGRRLSRAGIAAGVSALAFAVLVSVGAAVSPSGAPAVSEQYPRKVLICHKTRSKKSPFRTIRVFQRAVRAHLRHGDRRGSCARARFILCHKAKGKAQRKTITVKGLKRTIKHLRHGDRLGKCKKGKRRR